MMTNWGNALLKLSNEQDYQPDSFKIAQDKMKKLVAEGNKPSDDVCGRVFGAFAIVTLFYQYQQGSCQAVQPDFRAKPEHYLDFNNAREQAIKAYSA